MIEIFASMRVENLYDAFILKSTIGFICVYINSKFIRLLSAIFNRGQLEMILFHFLDKIHRIIHSVPEGLAEN